MGIVSWWAGRGAGIGEKMGGEDGENFREGWIGGMVGWKDMLPEDIIKLWKAWVKSLDLLSVVQLDRCVKISAFDEALELQLICVGLFD